MSRNTYLKSLKSLLTRSGQGRKSRKRVVRRTKLGVESLEGRVTPSIDTIGLLNSLGAELQSIKNTVDNNILKSSVTKLPIIGESLQNLGGTIDSGLQTVISDLETPNPKNPAPTITGIINAIESNDNGKIETAIDAYVPGASNAKVRALDPANGTIEITLDLNESGMANFRFNTGLPGLPFSFGSPSSNLDVGFFYDNLDFGMTNGNFNFFVNKYAQAKTGVNLDASVASGAILTGDFGLFTISGTVPPTNGIGLSGQISADVTGTSLANIGLDTPQFQNFQAYANLPFVGSIGSATGNVTDPNYKFETPHISGTFYLNWNLNGSDSSAGLDSLGASEPDVEIKDVTVGIGSLLDSVLGPLLTIVQDVTAPLEPVLNILSAPIPGLSDLGGPKVSLLDLANIINNTGLVVPPGIQQVISVAVDAAQLVTALDQINLGKGDATADLGTFSLDRGNQDLRTLSSPLSLDSLPTDGPGALDDLTSLKFLTTGVTSLGNLVASSVGDAAVKDAIESAATELNQYLSAEDSVQITFPLIEDPANGILQLLLGNDADLVALSGDLVTPPIRNSVTLAFFPPLEFDLGTSVQVSAHFKIAYDTFGLREIARDGGTDPADLLDGLYIDASQPLIAVSGSVGASLGASTGPIGLYGEGFADLNGNFSVGLNGNEPDNKLRLFKGSLDGDLFKVSGSLSVHVGVDAGVQLTPYVRLQGFNFPVFDKKILSPSDVNPTNPVVPVTTAPSFGEPPQDETLDIASAPDSPGEPYTVDIVSDSKNIGAIDVIVNNTLYQQYQRAKLATLILINSSQTSATYVVTTPLHLDLKASGSSNALLIDLRSETEVPASVVPPGTQSPFHYTYDLTNHSFVVNNLTDESVGGLAQDDYDDIKYSGLNSLTVILPVAKNDFQVDSLPAFPVTLETPKVIAPSTNSFGVILTILEDLDAGIPAEVTPATPNDTFSISAMAIATGGTLALVGYSGNDRAEIDDNSSQENTTYNPLLKRTNLPSYTINSNSVSYVRPDEYRLPGHPAGTVSFSGLSSLSLVGQDAPTGGIIGRNYTLQSWSPGTALNIQGGSGDDYFDVGDGRIDLVSGTTQNPLAINIDGGGGNNTVVYDDSGDGNFSLPGSAGDTFPVTTDNPVWKISAGSVERSNTIYYDFTGKTSTDDQVFKPTHISKILIEGSESEDSMNVLATAVGVPTTISADNGNDAVTVGVNITSLGSPLTVLGGGGDDTLRINDPYGSPAGSSPRSYTIGANSISVGASVLNYSGLQAVTLNTSTLGSNVTIQGTPTGTSVNVLAPDATTVAANLDGVGGPLNIVGDTNLTTLNLTNSNETTAHTFDVTSSTVTRDGATPVTYSSVKELRVSGTTPANTYNVESTAAGVATVLAGGLPHDTFNFAPTTRNLDSIRGPVTVQDVNLFEPGVRATVNFYDDLAIPTRTYSVTDLDSGPFPYGTVLNRSGSGAISVPFSPVDLNLYIDQPAGTVSVPQPIPTLTHLNIITGQSYTIDAHALLAPNIFIDETSYETGSPITLRLLPGVHTVTTTGADQATFTTLPDGTIAYDPSLEGVFTGAGTRSLTIAGRSITVDVTALGESDFSLDGVSLDATKAETAQVLPGQHFVTSSIGIDRNWFTVGNNGTISYDPTLQGVFNGAGTTSLTVVGRSVTFDSTQFGASTIYIDGIAHDGSSAFTVKLLPGEHVLDSTIGIDRNVFSVNNNGTVAYDPTLEGAFTGAGTTTLDIVGRSVTFDPTQLGASTIYVDGTAYSGSAVFSVNLLPGQHVLDSTIGIDRNVFSVNNDGTVSYDPTLEGAFTGAGTTTLNVVGRSVTFDPTQLGVSTVYVDGIAYSGDASFSVKLLPGDHVLSSTIGLDRNGFSVNNDGTVAYDAGLEGAFTGAGTPTLTLVGRSVTLNTTALGNNDFTLDGISYVAGATMSVPFLPGQHALIVNIGTYWFTVNPDGTIAYDPSLDNIFSGQGTTTLVYL